MRELKIDKEKVDKILLISLAGIGDTLLFTPAIKVIRRNFPNAEIVAMVRHKGALEILENNPNVDELIIWDFLEKGLWRSLKFVLGLRQKEFPLTIIAYPSNRIEYNGINFLIGSKLRPTHRYNHLDLRCGGFLNHQIVQEDDTRHVVFENLMLLEKIGFDIRPIPSKLDIFLTEEDVEMADSFFEKHGLNKIICIGYHPGTATQKNQMRRRWAPEKFAKLGQVLKREISVEILVFGGPDEIELKHFVASGMTPPGIEINDTSMRETAALIKRCNLFVSNDSSLMHVAAATQVPTVGIYGPINHRCDGPYGTKSRIVRKALDCSPCFFYSPKFLTCYANRNYQCMRAITVEDVYASCRELLREAEAIPMPPRETSAGGSNGSGC